MSPKFHDQLLIGLNDALPKRFPDADPSNPVDAIVFDMDGTLVDVAPLAQKYLNPREGSKKDFHAFHLDSEFAPAHQHVVQAAQQAYRQGTAVLVVTARMTDYVGLSARWLAKQPVWMDRMYMRASKDFRKDHVIKREINERILADGFRVVHAWDDNPDIIALWNELGIPTTRVPNPAWHPTSDDDS